MVAAQDIPKFGISVSVLPSPREFDLTARDHDLEVIDFDPDISVYWELVGEADEVPSSGTGGVDAASGDGGTSEDFGIQNHNNSGWNPPRPPAWKRVEAQN